MSISFKPPPCGGPRGLLALSAGLALSLGSSSATPYSDINAAAAKGPIHVHPLRGRLSMLDGSGGNITVLSGPQGFVLVDCGIAVSRGIVSCRNAALE